MPIGNNRKWPYNAVNSSTTNSTIVLAAYIHPVGCRKIQLVVHLGISTQFSILSKYNTIYYDTIPIQYNTGTAGKAIT